MHDQPGELRNSRGRATAARSGSIQRWSSGASIRASASACPSSTTSSRPTSTRRPRKRDNIGPVRSASTSTVRPGLRARALARVSTRVERPSARWQLVKSRTLCRWRSRSSVRRSAICSNRSPHSRSSRSTVSGHRRSRTSPGSIVEDSMSLAAVRVAISRSRTFGWAGEVRCSPDRKYVAPACSYRGSAGGSAFLRVQ